MWVEKAMKRLISTVHEKFYGGIVLGYSRWIGGMEGERGRKRI